VYKFRSPQAFVNKSFLAEENPGLGNRGQRRSEDKAAGYILDLGVGIDGADLDAIVAGLELG
jgi:hypothetical protein